MGQDLKNGQGMAGGKAIFLHSVLTIYSCLLLCELYLCIIVEAKTKDQMCQGSKECNNFCFQHIQRTKAVYSKIL